MDYSKIPLIGNILEKYLQSSGETGLNQTRNTVKMAVYMLAPFLVGFIFAKVFLPPHYEDLGSLLVLVLWLVGIVLFYSNAKAKASSYLPFPQSHWFFPDGQQHSYDLMLNPNGVEEMYEYSDGSFLYRFWLKNRLAYQERDRPYPDVFDNVIMKLPTNFNDSFDRNSEGEFFFEGLFITHPSCENIQVTVVGWDERGSYRIPVCVVTGCSYYARKMLENAGTGYDTEDERKREMRALQIQKAFVLELKAKNIEIMNRNRFLEKEHEEYTEKTPVNIKKLSDDRLEEIAKRHGNIMYAKRSLRDRILNLRTFAYAIVIVGFALLISHYVFGYP